MARTIMVTGGCGFIGSHITDSLVEKGEAVVVVDDLSTGSLENLNEKATFYCGDIAEKDFLEKVFRQHNIKAVIHQAAKINTGVMNEVPLHDVQTSVVGTINIIEACLRFDIERLVFASSVGVYGKKTTLPVKETDPTIPIYSYGIAKLCAEQYLDFYNENYGLQYHCLRYANVYGPRQPIYGEVGVAAIFTDKVLNAKPMIIYGTGDHLRDYIYVSDVANVTIAMLEISGCHTLNIGRGRGVSTMELYTAFSKHYDIAVNPVFKPEREGELGSFFCDTGKMESVCEYTPGVDITTGVDKTIAHYRGNT